MNDRDVASIVRSVVVDGGLPFSLVAVSAAASGWEVRLRRAHGGPPLLIAVPDGRPVAIRVAVQQRLEDEL